MNSIRHIFKYGYVLLTHYFAVLFSGKVERSDDLLLLRLDALGDFILWLDSAKEYRKIYPRRKITLLVNKSWLELAEALPYWDDVWGIDVKKFRYQPLYRIAQLVRLRRRGFEVLIQPRFSREFILEDSFVLSSDATQRISFEGDGVSLQHQGKRWGTSWYTRQIPNPPFFWGELKRNAEFIRELGLENFKTSLPYLGITVSDKPAAIQGDYYVIIPGAGSNMRCWPLEYFAKITSKIYEQTSLKGIICGAAFEQPLASGLMSLSTASLMDMTAKTSILELITIIKGAKFVLSNETSAVHIAAAVNTKSVCILGGGHFGRFVPYEVESLRQGAVLPVVVYKKMDCFNCDWRCIYNVLPGSPAPCVAGIDIKQVWAAVRMVIDE